MKQNLTTAALTSRATNTHLKGLQAYYTPAPWAKALAVLLPEKRPSIADFQCGNGSLLSGVANATTQHIYAADLSPDASACVPNIAADCMHMHHVDFLDLLPTLMETKTRFDLLLCNPPFSLTWPCHYQFEPLKQAHSLDSTSFCLAALPHLLTADGECLFIANDSTITRLREERPDYFANLWLHLRIPSFFPDANFTAAVLYFYRGFASPPPAPIAIDPTSPDDLANILQSWKHMRPTATSSHWHNPGTTRRYLACIAEVHNRLAPGGQTENVTLDHQGNLRTRVTTFQQCSSIIHPSALKAIQSINGANPYDLTVQRATRSALQALVNNGTWTISTTANAAIHQALAEYNAIRTPLTPVSPIQKLGWLDENDAITCTKDYLWFREGQTYEVVTEVGPYSYECYKTRFTKGKAEEEKVSTKGSDLVITIIYDSDRKAKFCYNPARIPDTHPLQDIVDHFAIPDVPHIAQTQPIAYQAALERIALLEKITT